MILKTTENSERWRFLTSKLYKCTAREKKRQTNKQGYTFQCNLLFAFLHCYMILKTAENSERLRFLASKLYKCTARDKKRQTNKQGYTFQCNLLFTFLRCYMILKTAENSERERFLGSTLYDVLRETKNVQQINKATPLSVAYYLRSCAIIGSLSCCRRCYDP